MTDFSLQPDNQSAQSAQSARADADLLLLSAYLDGALEAGEQHQFEQRLASDPTLQTDLDDLRQTTSVLHDLPPLEPPRSFALDPAAPAVAALARRRSFWGWLLNANRMQLGGALATVLLLVVLTTGVLMVQGGPGMGGAPVAEAPQAMMDEEIAPEIAPAAAATPTVAATAPAVALGDAPPTAAALEEVAEEGAPPAEAEMAEAAAADEAGEMEAAPAEAAPAVPPPAESSEQDVSGSAQSGGLAGESSPRDSAPAATDDDAASLATLEADEIESTDTSSPDTRDLESDPTLTAPTDQAARAAQVRTMLLVVVVLLLLSGVGIWLLRRQRR